jgi:hypothetical protein
MTKKELFDLNLHKWPTLIVKGNKITKEQAQEILIRTDNLGFSTNDHVFASQLYELVYGVKSDKKMYHISLRDYFEDENDKWNKAEELKNKIKEKYKIISNLEYLNNNRIVSSWIGGPHGWCSWDGYIGCNNYNIGKYPSVEEIYNEWKLIAAAFPFLELKCQLLSGETCEDDLYPIIEFSLKNGKVKIYKPKEILDYPSNNDMVNVFTCGARGCTLGQVENALQYIENKYE